MKKIIITFFCLTISFYTYSFDEHEFNSSIEKIFMGSFDYAAKKAALALNQAENNLNIHNTMGSSTIFSATINSSYKTGNTMIYLGEGDVLNQLNEQSIVETAFGSSLRHSRLLFHLGGNYKKSRELTLRYNQKITRINDRIEQSRVAPFLISRIIDYHFNNERIAQEYKTLKLLRKFYKEIKRRMALKISSILELQEISNYINHIQFTISELMVKKHSYIAYMSRYAPIQTFDYYKKYISSEFIKKIIKPNIKTCTKLFSTSKTYELNKIQNDKESNLIAISGVVSSNISFSTSSFSSNPTTNYGAQVGVNFNYPLLNNFKKSSIKTFAYYKTLIAKYKYKEIERSQKNISIISINSYKETLASFKKLASIRKLYRKDLVHFNQLEDASLISTSDWQRKFYEYKAHENHFSAMKSILVTNQLSSIYSCYLEDLNN
jgi:hypothetical protein